MDRSQKMNFTIKDFFIFYAVGYLGFSQTVVH